MLYLFLDFDGVLHTHSGKKFSLVNDFAKVIEKYPQVKIVFSTSWREYATLDFLKSFLPIELHDQCIGMTPWMKTEVKHVRYQEIQKYLEENNIKSPWIAVDDLSVLFPSGCENLFLVNGREGMNKSTAKLLEKRIKKELKKKID